MVIENTADRDELASQIVLKISRWRVVGVWIGGILMTVASVYLLHRAPGFTLAWAVMAVSWAGILFFGIASLVAPVLLFRGVSYLELDREQFIWRAPYQRYVCRWTEVSKFETVRYSGQNVVCFNLREPGKSSFKGWLPLLRLNRWRAGFDLMIPAWPYGVKAGELASQMNSFRDRALHENGAGAGLNYLSNAASQSEPN